MTALRISTQVPENLIVLQEAIFTFNLVIDYVKFHSNIIRVIIG